MKINFTRVQDNLKTFTNIELEQQITYGHLCLIQIEELKESCLSDIELMEKEIKEREKK